MNIVTSKTKDRVVENDFDKLKAEKMQSLKEVGVENIVPVKSKTKKQLLQDMDDMKNQAQERMSEARKQTVIKNQQRRDDKPRMTDDQIGKILEDRERRAYEARKITMR